MAAGDGAEAVRGESTVQIAFVARDFSRFGALVARLKREQDVELIAATTGAGALNSLKNRRLDLVIVDDRLDDMGSIDFVRQLVTVNPLANTAIVGSLPAEAFHEATEGLGVLMQLPPAPTEADAEHLLATLARIGGLLKAAP